MAGETALITGASMGLGEEFARQLAGRGVSVLLTARSRERLEALAAELEERHGVGARVLVCDLAEPGAAARIEQWVLGLPEEERPNWLVNNAGFGEAGPFEAVAPERVRDIAMVNMVALSELTARLLPVLKAAPRGTARIVNVGSVAAFQPIPYFSVYAASKAYVLSLSEGLAEELGPRNAIRVTCVCPGPTRTNFAANNNLDESLFSRGETASDVVAKALRASDRGQVVAATSSRLQTFATRLAPRVVVRKIAARVVQGYARKTGRKL